MSDKKTKARRLVEEVMTEGTSRYQRMTNLTPDDLDEMAQDLNRYQGLLNDIMYGIDSIRGSSFVKLDRTQLTALREIAELINDAVGVPSSPLSKAGTLLRRTVRSI